MLNTWITSPKETSTGTSGARSPALGAATKKSSSTSSSPGRGDEHVAAGAEPGQQRLGDERREHRGQRRVDGVAAGAEDLRAGLGREGMPGRDDSVARPAFIGSRTAG